VKRLVDQVAVVTGASRGIGRAIALTLAREGARVVVNYIRSHGHAEAVVAEIRAAGGEALTARADVSRVAEVDGLLEAALGAYKRVDTWVNNAGADILTGAGASMSDREKLDLLLAVDLRGTMLASWEAAHTLAAQETGGVIINMSWDHVLTGMAGTNPQMYAAVKGGVLAFSKSLARSVAPRVRVNILAPGWIETSFGASLDPDRHRQVAESTPLKRWGTAEDVAGAAVFLASPAASFITGQTLLVGGGAVM
jgi:3-oxoacyl-[acyl-carrier protein] reductase